MRAIAPITVSILATVRILAADEHPMDYVWEMEDRARVDHALELLETGTYAERRWVVSRFGDLFIHLNHPEEAWALQRFEELREIISVEGDEFVVSQALRPLRYFDADLVGPLYIDLLRDPSPNLRYRAVQYYAFTGDDPAAIPRLEAIWRFETVGWIRDEVMGAIASFDSIAFIDELVGMTRSDDRARAIRAFDILRVMRDPRISEVMVDLADDEDHPLRSSAVYALVQWPESERALAALLEATRDADASLRRAAVSSVWAFESEAIAERMKWIAAEEPDPNVRYAALKRIDKTEAEARTILHGAAALPDTPGNRNLRSFARHQLAPPAKPDRFYRRLLERQAQGEDIVWEAFGYERLAVPHGGCGGGSVSADDPGAFIIRADPQRNTTRCWDAPMVTGDFSTRERKPAGEVVKIRDYHDHYGELWVMVDSCWMRRDRLADPSRDRPRVDSPAGKLWVEIDLFTSDLRDRKYRQLFDLGRAERFDRSGSVTAIALDIPLDPPSVGALLDLYGGGEELADLTIRRLLEQVPDGFAVGTELRNRLVEALSPEPE